MSASICIALFSFVNNSSETVVMRLFWYDHNIKDFPVPAEFFVADVESNGRVDGIYNYNGTAFICVAGDAFKIFETWRGDHNVICTWDGELIQVAEE
jgi:hypothetical protein